jgi:hypothetical protein
MMGTQEQMTSIYLIIFTLGTGMEIGYVTGKTSSPVRPHGRIG